MTARRQFGNAEVTTGRPVHPKVLGPHVADQIQSMPLEMIHRHVRALLAGGVLGAGALVSHVAQAALPVVDSCQESAYLERTAEAADRVLDWDYAFAGDPERCLRVRVGQSVRWMGSFGDHPLDPDEGDVPNPIASHANGLVVF